MDRPGAQRVAVGAKSPEPPPDVADGPAFGDAEPHDIIAEPDRRRFVESDRAEGLLPHHHPRSSDARRASRANRPADEIESRHYLRNRMVSDVDLYASFVEE